jgi:hypothetical protein
MYKSSNWGQFSGAMIGQSWHGSYNSYLEDDEALARELQEMEDSLGSISLYDGLWKSNW